MHYFGSLTSLTINTESITCDLDYKMISVTSRLSVFTNNGETSCE